MIELGAIQISLIILSAMLIGISKTGLPTLGILVVATMASVFPARESIGIVLPMLIAGDIIAVTYYRRSVHWRTLWKLVPWVLGGLISGYLLLLFNSSSRSIEMIIGTIVLSLIVVQFSREYFMNKSNAALPQSKSFIIFMGTLAGFTTMVGNAAGPIMAIFLLAIALPKKEFIGTGAWFFLTVNLIKVPMYTSLGLISLETLSINLWLLPFIIIGAVIGIKFLPLIPQKLFNTIILVLSFLGGLQLLLP
ncbi:sulfite exporter TauE/SafE family protein [Salipaludibacillus sp. CF4.18]|uniref:sulfite exporter TauE/SafE family protein n=1 Tax=Salipaludibacillus sp. CF4.18 TaxID=3373081 RepID=UPI003EE43E90